MSEEAFDDDEVIPFKYPFAGVMAKLPKPCHALLRATLSTMDLRGLRTRAQMLPDGPSLSGAGGGGPWQRQPQGGGHVRTAGADAARVCDCVT